MTSNQREQWQTQGYIVLRGVFDSERTARLREICDDILEQWRTCNPETTKPGGGPDATVMRHLNHPGYFTPRSEGFSELMDAIADEKILDVARTILDEEPLFRCTSYFFNPQNTSRDGNWHRDCQFTTSGEDEERALMAKGDHSGIQMQIALAPTEDVEFVPGSHLRWDTPEEYAIRKADGGRNNRSNDMPGALRLKQDPGDAVLFNSFGHHRGRYHADKLRRTLMLTYTGCTSQSDDYFTRQSWFLEAGYLDGLQPRTRAFFERFVRTFADYWREKELAGAPS